MVGKPQPLDNFHKNKRAKIGFSSWCKTCNNWYNKQHREIHKGYHKDYSERYYQENKKEINLRCKAYREENKVELKEKNKNAKLKSRYGITREQYDNLLEAQNKKCFICKNEKKLVVDHDHTSGKTRKLLCDSCNKGLGSFKDNPCYLRAAVDYLDLYKC